MSGVFAEGEKALFIDSKQRRYLIQLNAEGEFHSHAGFVPHTSVIGTLPGQPVESTKGSKYIVLRPTLEDFVIEMPRGAQVTCSPVHAETTNSVANTPRPRPGGLSCPLRWPPHCCSPRRKSTSTPLLVVALRRPCVAGTNPTRS